MNRHLAILVSVLGLWATPASAFFGTISYRNAKFDRAIESGACGGLSGKVEVGFVDYGEGLMQISLTAGSGTLFVPGIYEQHGHKVSFHASDVFLDDVGGWAGSISVAGKAKLRSSQRVKKAKLFIHLSDPTGCIVVGEVTAK
jgi:hypothetical protein